MHPNDAAPSAEPTTPAPPRPLAKWEKWAIFVAPYLFAWLTLRKGHTTVQRAVSFGWLAWFGVCGVISLAVPPADDSKHAEATPPSPGAAVPPQPAPVPSPPATAPAAAAPAFTPVYTFVQDEAVPAGATPRFCARITVPTGLARDVLSENVAHALRTEYSQHAAAKPGAVCIAAYKAGDDTSGTYSAAKGDYAPEGDWTRADASVPVERWRVAIRQADEYDAVPNTLKFAPGAKVKLVPKPPFGKPGGTVRVMAGFPDVPPVVGEVSSGTEATIVEGRVFFVTATFQVPYYHVLMGYQGGWVPEAVCRASEVGAGKGKKDGAK